MKICFPDDDSRKYNRNKNHAFIHPQLSEYYETPLYTLIWHDCDQCTELLINMNNLNLKNIYINGGFYFADLTEDDSVFDEPLLYKDDELIGDNLFDIYNAIFIEN